jgi:ferredoxin
MAHEKYQQCIDACNECVAACEHCAVACLHEEDIASMVALNWIATARTFAASPLN